MVTGGRLSGQRELDPEGNNFDLSVHGFQTIEYAADREKEEGSKETVDA